MLSPGGKDFAPRLKLLIVAICPVGVAAERMVTLDFPHRVVIAVGAHPIADRAARPVGIDFFGHLTCLLRKVDIIPAAIGLSFGPGKISASGSILPT